VEMTAVWLRSCGEAFGSGNGMKDALIKHSFVMALKYYSITIFQHVNGALKGPLPALVCAATAAV